MWRLDCYYILRLSCINSGPILQDMTDSLYLLCFTLTLTFVTGDMTTAYVAKLDKVWNFNFFVRTPACHINCFQNNRIYIIVIFYQIINQNIVRDIRCLKWFFFFFFWICVKIIIHFEHRVLFSWLTSWHK